MRNFLYKNRCIDLLLQITNKSWITPLIPQKISTYKLIVINCCIQLSHQIPPPLIRDGKNCLCPNIYIYMNFFHPKVGGQVLFPLSCHALPCFPNCRILFLRVFSLVLKRAKQPQFDLASSHCHCHSSPPPSKKINKDKLLFSSLNFKIFVFHPWIFKKFVFTYEFRQLKKNSETKMNFMQNLRTKTII